MFYDRFYQMCQSAGVTPSKVADDLGLNKSTVYMWKKQGTTPKYQTLKKLERYFGFDLADIVSSEGGGKGVAAHKDGNNAIAFTMLEELECKAKPLVDYLRENYHPHTAIVITAERAVIVEDVMSVPFSREG